MFRDRTIFGIVLQSKHLADNSFLKNLDGLKVKPQLLKPACHSKVEMKILIL